MSKKHPLVKVGKGVFTRCFELNESTVLLESVDPIKKAMSDGLFPNSKLFPTVKKYKGKYSSKSSETEFYTMKYYKGRPNRSTKQWLQSELKPYHYGIYLELFELRKRVESSIKGKRNIDRQSVWNEAFKTLSNKKLAKLLIEANNVCCEYGGNVMFDCSPKNIATDKGELILLDCFYSTKELYRIKFHEKPNWTLNWED